MTVPVYLPADWNKRCRSCDPICPIYCMGSEPGTYNNPSQNTVIPPGIGGQVFQAPVGRRYSPGVQCRLWLGVAAVETQIPSPPGHLPKPSPAPRKVWLINSRSRFHLFLAGIANRTNQSVDCWSWIQPPTTRNHSLPNGPSGVGLISPPAPYLEDQGWGNNATRLLLQVSGAGVLHHQVQTGAVLIAVSRWSRCSPVEYTIRFEKQA